MKISVNIFDISNYLFAAYSAITKDGIPTFKDAYYKSEPVFILNTVLGMVYKDLNLAADYGYPNTHTIIVFDHPDETFRKKIYPKYKANRPPKDPELLRQIELAFEMFQTQGFFCISEPGVESDDVIGSIATKLEKNHVPTLIHGKDKDTLYCVGDYVKQYDRARKVYYDRSKVIEKLGVPPERVFDYLTMLGDSADNVSGIPGVGKKTAVDLLSKYTLKQLITNPDLVLEVKPKNAVKIRDYFASQKDEILLSHELIKLKTDLQLNINLSDFIKREPEKGNFLELIL